MIDTRGKQRVDIENIRRFVRKNEGRLENTLCYLSIHYALRYRSIIVMPLFFIWVLGISTIF